jgi:hypothetical protein
LSTDYSCRFRVWALVGAQLTKKDQSPEVALEGETS